MAATVADLIKLISERKVVRVDAVTTSAGEQTTTYLDIPGVLCDGTALRLVAQVLFQHLVDHNLHDANMVAGPMTGSIPLVVSLAGYDLVPAGFEWSVIRDKPKTHGLGRWFVGAEPGPDDKVILVDDVASTGESLLQAYRRVNQTGAQTLAIVPLVDRGDKAMLLLAQETYVPYLPVLTYRDLGIETL